MATVDITGKKFMKKTSVEVIDATEHQVMLQDVNKQHEIYTIPRSEFDEDYELGEDILEKFAVKMTTADDGMAVPNSENNTKEVKEIK